MEFKRGLPSDAKVARSLCAFANTRGGLLFIGVGDRGELEGAPHPEETARKLVEIARRRILPPIEPRIAVTSIDGVRLVVARVAASRSRPHAVLHEHRPEEVVVRSGSSRSRGLAADARGVEERPRRRARSWMRSRRASRVRRGHATKDPNGSATVAEIRPRPQRRRQRARPPGLAPGARGFPDRRGSGPGPPVPGGLGPQAPLPLPVGLRAARLGAGGPRAARLRTLPALGLGRFLLVGARGASRSGGASPLIS
ncbi:MAG: ATP-binding protein [Planctomycetes bacterium]|nr:ATP-binding protein [Planctomycetota bacterium]